MSYNEPPPPYGNPTPQPGYGGGQPVGTSQLAIWSLVLGILGLVCCGFFTGVPAVILSVLARKEIAGGRKSGSGLATAGLVIGIIATIWGVISTILVLNGTISFEGSS